MAGRLVHCLVAGAAIVGGMAVQGDLNLGMHPDDREIDRAVDRIVDRETDKSEIRSENKRVKVDIATNRDVAAAVAELVRAEGSLAAAKVNDEAPAVIEQAEHRRDLARQAVERIADDAKAETRENRDELRQNIRDEVRDAVRS